jgi:hypothetical protein
MNEALLMLHFVGFGMGVAAAAGNGTVMGQIAQAPGDAPVLSRLQPIFVRIGQIGVGLLWLTGLIMVWTRWGGPENLPSMFWVKFGCVIILTALVIYSSYLAARARAGDANARRQLPVVGPLNGVFLGLVIIFAVLAFN